MKRSLLAIAPLIALIALGSACSSWERQTYQYLSASKAIIDQAALDYNAGTIPRTATVRALIERTRAAQTAATESFEEYAVLKVSKQVTSLAAQQQLVVQAVNAIPPLVAAIHALYAKGGGGGAH